MKRLPGLLAALIVVSSCLPPVVDESSTSTPASATSLDPGSESPSPTTTAVPASTTLVPPGPPVGWIAPSGVSLAVTGVDGDTIEVLTPCGNLELLTEGTPIYEVDVMIDPGHGGPVDTGAVALTGLQEKTINLQVSLAVQDLLNRRGIASMLTRTADYPIPIRMRSTYSDLVGAQAIVSIHHNAPTAPASDVPGIEIFVENETPESARLGGLLYQETMSALGRFDVDWDRAPDAGVMTVLNTEGEDAYGMVRLPQAHSALLELGYIANPAEAALYEDPDYVAVAAAAIANAIEAFLESGETGSPLVDGRVFNPERGVGRDQCVEPDLGLTTTGGDVTPDLMRR